MKRLDAYYTNDFGDRLSASTEEAEDGSLVRFSDIEGAADDFVRLSAKCDCLVHCEWCTLVRSTFGEMQR